MSLKHTVSRLTLVFTFVLLTAVGSISAQDIAPCDPAVDYATSAMAVYEAGEYETALSGLHCAALRDLRNIDLHAAYLQAALRTGRLTTADTASRYLETLAVERFDDIIVQMEAALQADPSDEGAAVVLTFARYPLQDSDIARIQAINPDNVLALMYAGRKAVYQDNNPEAARAAFERALALAGDDPEILIGMAFNYLYGLNDTEGALTLVERALTIDPLFAASYYARGNYHEMMGDVDAAIADYTRAIELDGYDYTVFNVRAGLLSTQGENAAALEDFRYVLSVNPASPFALNGIILAALATDDADARTLAADSFLNARTEIIDGDTLTSDTPVTVSSTAGRMARIPVRLESGQTVTISAVAADPASLDPLLMVVDPEGGAVAFNDDIDAAAGDYSAVVTFTPAMTGDYLILATHSGAGSEGEMTVSLALAQ